jgi:hypothetical protein
MAMALARSGQNEVVCEIKGSKRDSKMQRIKREGVCWRRQPSHSPRTPAIALFLCRERESAGVSKASSRRWGEVDGGEWRRTEGSEARA